MIFYPTGTNRRNEEYEAMLARMTPEERKEYVRKQQDRTFKVIAAFCGASLLICLLLFIGAIWSQWS